MLITNGQPRTRQSRMPPQIVNRVTSPGRRVHIGAQRRRSRDRALQPSCLKLVCKMRAVASCRPPLIVCLPRIVAFQSSCSSMSSAAACCIAMKSSQTAERMIVAACWKARRHYIFVLVIRDLTRMFQGERHYLPRRWRLHHDQGAIQ